jgi:anti-sigma factor ChrR (cupin superfamily)
MESYKLEDMVRGWFIGNFTPSLHQTNDVEVAIQKYKAGDYENAHFHKIATEYTAIVMGEVEMNGKKYEAGDIIIMRPNQTTDLKAISDAICVVVKIPGANNDKYLSE